MDGYLDGYAVVAVMALVGVVFVATGFLANRLMRPDGRHAGKAHDLRMWPRPGR